MCYQSFKNYEHYFNVDFNTTYYFFKFVIVLIKIGVVTCTPGVSATHSL